MVWKKLPSGLVDMPKVTGTIKIDGVTYPIQEFTINWDNALEPYYMTGDPTLHFFSPYTETEEQRDKRLNPRKYDSCKFCDHYRFRHESNYGKCRGKDYDEYEEDIECDCKEFV